MLDDLDKVMASFPCINFTCCKSERFFQLLIDLVVSNLSFSRSLFCFGSLIDLAELMPLRNMLLAGISKE